MTQQKIKQKKEQISKLERVDSKINANLVKVNEEMYDKIEPFEKKIEAIRAPYKKKIIELDNKQYKNNNTIYSLKADIVNLELDIKIKESTKTKKHNVESVTALIDRYDLGELNAYDIEPVIEKKPLLNGIQVFRATDDDKYSMWLAFYGMKLVGLSYRRKGEHRGDETTPYSFIGGVALRNVYKIKKKLSKWSDKLYSVNATFTEWALRLGKLDPKKMKEILLNDKNIKEIQNSSEWR